MSNDMSNDWINFLNENGASFNEKQEVNFNQSIKTFSGKLYLTDLSWLGLIEIRGEDKEIFLQGQLTNDINAVSSSLSQLSGLCTPKGRLRTLFSIFSRTGNLYLQLPKPLLADNLKRLKMFVMMSKVELNDASDELIKIGLSGSKAEKHLIDAGYNLPGEINMVTEHNGISLIRLSGDIPRFECIGSVSDIKNLWQNLQPKAQLLDTSNWRLLDIEAGRPKVFAETNEAFIPQMLNLQVLNGINFKKGCYTGQEIVARMQYLGKLKRRMYRMHCNVDDKLLPKPGNLLFSAKSKSGQGAGHIVDAQKTLEDGIDMLAVITTEAIDNNDIFLDEAMEIPLSQKTLPYTFD